MDKALFLFLSFIFLVSCDIKTDLPPAHAKGQVNHISVIIDDVLWNGEIGDSLRNKFASPVVGLPQEEPLFTMNQYPVKLLEGFMTSSRNIIVIKQGPKRQFRISGNKAKNSQNIFHISGQTNAEILEILETHDQEIIALMRKAEIEEAQKRMDTALLDQGRIARKFNVLMDIPTSYKFVAEHDGFIWLKKEIISGNTSLLIYEAPLSSLDRNPGTIFNIIKMRDSIGTLYIHGTVPESRMITEQAYAPYFSQVKLNGNEAFETRGTWELKNDYMSGPFLNYAIKDVANNRLLIVEGFCYAPSKEKRDLMHELEAIIKSIRIIKRQP